MDASLSLVAKNQWLQIASLYDQSRLYFCTTAQELESRIANQFTTKLQYSSALFHTFLPQKVFCLAYHLDMFFPLYQWIVVARTAEDIASINFSYAGKKYECNADEISLASDKSIIIKCQLKIQANSLI